MSRWSLIYWGIFALTMALYAVMVAWSLPYIAQSAGGLPPFDMRPTGYSYSEVVDFLSALSTEGREFYLSTQHRLDTAYPALLAFVLAAGGIGLTRNFLRKLGLVVAITAIAGGLADYVENRAVAVLLRGDAPAPDPAYAGMANWATLIKSGFTTVAMVLLLLLLVVWFFRRGRVKG